MLLPILTSWKNKIMAVGLIRVKYTITWETSKRITKVGIGKDLYESWANINLSQSPIKTNLSVSITRLISIESSVLGSKDSNHVSCQPSLV